MHPYFYERFPAGSGFLLRDLRFVVREFEVNAAAMELVLRAEIKFGDRGVLNVPSGPAVADRGRGP